MAVTENKYQLGTAENQKFLQDVRDGLLSFGHQFPSPGGSSYYLGDDGTPWKDRNRETWITSRMTHVYSIGSMLGHEGSEALADAALKGLRGELHDDQNGGWYAGLTKDNEIVPTKQCYAHAFVILAASSGVLACREGAAELLKDALALYDLRFWNEEEGLSCDTWNTEFTELDSYRGLNANMHTVEAFLAAADVTGDEKYRVRAGRIIDHVLVWAKDNNWRIPEHFSSDWVPDLECNKDRPDDQFKPYGATPGHGIEWARLITQWALSTYKEDKAGAAPYIEAAENLYNRAVADAWNANHSDHYTFIKMHEHLHIFFFHNFFFKIMYDILLYNILAHFIQCTGKRFSLHGTVNMEHGLLVLSDQLHQYLKAFQHRIHFHRMFKSVVYFPKKS